ncbi:MAG: phosphatidylserine/phosphatidylglycerophosphate/cardiolipin synthase family protein [Bacteroidales bacterium]|jgi:cardiolipin synthase|nr:phosphatidylserine/phosphatidylglycerophosphate/cardiolipin synthase family protein [Bacteroidales bacterium]
MEANQTNNFLLFDDPLTQFSAMIDDIRNAKEQILLQTFRLGNDEIGQKFKLELTKKAKEGLEIYLLLDAFGTRLSKSYFSEMMKFGANVKFFKKIRISFGLFRKNHRRNHRKLLIIDHQITYIGSSNLTNYCLNWREDCLRIESTIANKFRKIFFENYDIADYLYANRKNKKALARKTKYSGFEIICDVPSTIQIPTRNKFINLINSAKKEITITTPYFLPGHAINKAIKDALARNVKVKLIIPLHSDVKFFDIVRNRSLGKYFKAGVEIIEYQTSNLHAKLFLVDDEEFVLGSSNFDYRSFWYMYEINICGKDANIIHQIKTHFQNTEKESIAFEYEKWEKRSINIKIIENLLLPLRHLF